MREDIKELRFFGIRLSIGLVVLRFVLEFWRGHVIVQLPFIALGVFAISLIVPKALKPISWIFDKIITIIGKIIAFFVLGLFFYLVVTPVGLFMKIAKRDPLHRIIDKEKETYWIKRDDKMSDPKRIERQF